MALNFLNNGYFGGKLGIGTESPDAKLSISDILGISGTGNNTYGQVDLVNTQTGASGDEIGPFITFRGKRGAVDTTIAAYGAIGAVNTGTSGNSKGALTFLVKNAVGAAQDLVEQMRISTGGNVGIGTASPTAKLQVAGTTTYNSDSAQALRVCDSTDVSKGIHIGFDTTLDKGIIQSGDFGVAYKGLLLNPNSGNVGIGTTSPNNKLDVNGDVFINSNYTANVAAQDLTIGKTTTGDHGLTIVTSNANTAGIFFGDNNNNDAGMLKYQHSSNSMQFVTNRSEKMRVTSAGGISFGSTGTAYGTSGQILKSNGNASPTWIDGSAIPGVPAGSGTVNYLARWTPDVNTLATGVTYDNGTNVGILTTNPLDRLQVSGVISATANDTAYSNGYFAKLSSDFGPNALKLTSRTGDILRATDYGSTVSILTGNPTSVKMFINSAGNVGIGTTSPGTKLEVDGDIGIGRVAGGYTFRETVGGGERASIKSNATNELIFSYGGSTEAMRIDDSGNVGIGVTGPATKLQVNGGVLLGSTYSQPTGSSFTTANSQLILGGAHNAEFNTSGVKLLISGYDNDSGVAVYPIFAQDENGNADFWIRNRLGSAALPRAYFAGDVGIGTVSPDEKLHIADIDDVNIYLESTDTTVAVGQSYGGLIWKSNDASGIGARDTGRIQLISSGAVAESDMLFFTTDYNVAMSEKMRITSTGNVGIGTTIPSEKLEVYNAQVADDVSGIRNSAFRPHLTLQDLSTNSNDWQVWADGGVLSFLTGDVSAVNKLTTERMRINTTGNVGIGTTNIGAQSNLYLGANSSSEGGQITLQKATGGTLAAHIDAYTSGGIDYMRVLSGTDTATAAAPFVFDLTNTRLGIGTTTPGAKLDVAGTGNFTGLVSGITPVNAANFVTKAYADGLTPGAGVFLPLAGGTLTGNLNLTYAYPRINLTDTNNDSDYSIINNDGIFGIYDVTNNSYRLSISAAGDATFAGNVTAPTFIGNVTGNLTGIVTATSSLADGVTGTTQGDSDDSELIATTAFVQNLIETIPAGLVFQGTWNAATNTPTLTSGSGTTGHFYIVSTSGSTNLDGITDWVTGDWAVFVEVGATDAWQKIDNSSVLDGIGTGQTLPLWSGSGTSNTLGNSSITQDASGNQDVGGGITADYFRTDTATTDYSLISRNSVSNSTLYVQAQQSATDQWIARFNYGSAIANGGDNVLTVAKDNSYFLNTNVGIGTDNPVTKLQIDDPADFSVALSKRGSTSSALKFTLSNPNTTTNSWKIEHDASEDLKIFGYSADNLLISTNSTERMRITNSGNVGIGTTSPVAKLDVLGRGTGPTVFDYLYATDAGLRIHGDESAMDIVGTDSGDHASTILLRNGNEGFGLLNNPNLNTLQFKSFTATADNFSIHSTGSNVNSLLDIITLEKTGNVGIGTTSPDNLLTIESSGDTILQINRNDNTIGGGNRTGIIQFGAKGTWGTNLATSKIWSYAEETFTSTANGTSLRFFTTELGAATPDEKMIIDTNGNVGIGTAGPGAKLEVSGSLFFRDFVRGYVGNSTTQYVGATWLNASDGVFYVRSADVDKVVLNSNGDSYLNGGNVGIGTTGPSVPLHVDTSNDLVAYFKSSDNKASIGVADDDTTAYLSAENGRLGFGPGIGVSTANITILQSNYSVGIGTVTPQSKLQVAGGIQMADDTTTASATKVGTMRYRTGTEYVEVTGTELITNGDFATDTNWTKNAEWTISGGKANAANSVSYHRIIQSGVQLSSTTLYRLIFTVSNLTSGGVICVVGNTNGLGVIANGTYVQYVTSASTAGSSLQIASNPTFTGSIDNVSLMEVTAEEASYADMCMQTGASTYEWVNIVRNTY